MGSQLRWLERTPDKREVDGSIPFEPTKIELRIKNLEFRKKNPNSKLKILTSILKHIEKYIDKLMKGKLVYQGLKFRS